MDALTNAFSTITNIHSLFAAAIESGQVIDLKVQIFKKLISCFQNLNKIPSSDLLENKEILININKILLKLLNTLDLPLECHLVASKAFCTCNVLLDPANAIKNVADIISKVGDNVVISPQECDVVQVCLCLALLELNVKVWESNDCSVLFNVLFPICERAAYRYSSMTLLAFRSLVKIFDLVNITNNSKSILDDILTKYVGRVMDLIMSNWESPLTGVREQNVLLFDSLQTVTNATTWLECLNQTDEWFSDDSFKQNPLLFLVLNCQTWMLKCKYFILTVLLRRGNTYELLKHHKHDILCGLQTSLEYSHLAPAGADLYKACISNIQFNHWKEIFFPFIIDILSCGKHCRLMKQNVMNHWIQSTIKSHPESYNLLFENMKEWVSVKNLSSFISLLKMGRKNGSIACFDGQICDIVKVGLMHFDETVRADAVLILCVPKVKSRLPSADEIGMFKTFLIDNVNYDCSRLRQLIVVSFTLFLTRIHDYLVCFVKHHEHCHDLKILLNDDSVKTVVNFLQWLYQFLISNLEDGCNFQRKYTSLLMFDEVFNCINNVSVNQIKENNSLCINTFIRYLYESNFTSDHARTILFCCVLYPSDVVKEAASDILCKHFQFTEKDASQLVGLYSKGKELCSERMFYRVESGALLIKTVVVMTATAHEELKSAPVQHLASTLLSNKSSVLVDLLETAQYQKEELFKDILNAASNGSPLYGIITAVVNLVTTPTSPEFDRMTSDDIEKLLAILESVVEKLLNALSQSSAKITDFAPSFADMGESIACIAQESMSDVDKSEQVQVQLSSAQQLVLNCIWLNIKVCCWSVSRLVLSCISTMNVESRVERCVDLLGLVLCRCRHKGAIEAAGTAVQQITKWLTSQDNVQLQRIPAKLLDRIFEKLLASDEGTVSRRSAGLAILVHRIIAGDSSQKKRLIHDCVERLVDEARSPVVESPSDLVDLPQSRAIHLLCGLVLDATLRQQMAQHVGTIVTVCFTSLSCSIWIIRNAALQLFGALLPKLVGQKKHQENEDGSESYTIAFEELYFHFENLFYLISKQFDAVFNDATDITRDSQLMPALTLLSNLTMTMHVCFNEKLRKVSCDFKKYSQLLFSSPILHVRKLAAKVNSNFCLPLELNDNLKMKTDQIVSILKNSVKNCKNIDQNLLHGLLLNVKYLVSKFNKLCQSIDYLKTCKVNILALLKRLFIFKDVNSIPYFTKVVLLKILCYTNKHDVYSIQECLQIIESGHSLSFGYTVWIDRIIDTFFEQCTFNDINLYITIMLNKLKTNNAIYFLYCLKYKIENCDFEERYNNFNNIIPILVNNCILERNNVELLSISLEVIFVLINGSDLNHTNYNEMAVHLYERCFKSTFTVMCRGLCVPVICKLMSKEFPESYTKELINVIYKWSSADDEFNEDVRMASVNGLIGLADYLRMNKLDNDLGMLIWKSACNLLQDEIAHVRIEATRFVTKLSDFNLGLIYKVERINPYVALKLMYTVDKIELLMDRDFAIKHLWYYLFCDSSINLDLGKNGDSNLNPFDHGINNIYRENVKIVDLVYNEIMLLIHSSNCKVLHKVMHSVHVCNSMCVSLTSDEYENKAIKKKILEYRTNILASLLNEVTH